MFRITRIVPTAVLTVAALALVAPAAQARSTQDWAAHRGTQVHSVVVTTGDTPLANPVQLPQNLTAGLMHATGELMHPSTVQVPIDKIPATPVTVPDSSGNGFDWTAAAIGAGVSGILILMLVGGVGFRRRGQLAA